jgi:acyl-[acyl-carrier-protein] desaturase
MNRIDLLRELEPVAAQLFNRHLAAAREWFPHELVPYDRARPFVAGRAWSESDTDCGGAVLTPAVRAALFVNVLTEDNLPYYFNDVDRMFGRQNVWGDWARYWTAEEGRHAIVLRDYLTVTRAIDLRDLERARMIQVSKGDAPAPDGPHHGLVYLCLQELATRISHRNTAKLVGDSAAEAVMAQVAFDENLHYLFYRDAATAAIAMDPSGMVIAMEEIVRTFAMPGKGIPNFEAHSAAIARAGIYDLTIHYEQILLPVVVKHWKIADLAGLTAEAEIARDKLLTYIDRLGRISEKLKQRREREKAADLAKVLAA